MLNINNIPIAKANKAFIKKSAFIEKQNIKKEPINIEIIYKCLKYINCNPETSTLYEKKYKCYFDDSNRLVKEFNWYCYSKEDRYKQKYNKITQLYYYPNKWLGNKKILHNAVGRYLFKHNKIHKQLKQFKNIEQAKLLHKLEGAIIGCTQSDKIDCIRIDIDSHSENKKLAFDNVVNLFDIFYPYIPLLVNVSDNGGFHIYYKLDKYINKSELKNFKKRYNQKFNDKKFKIEFPTNLKIPWNPEYNTLIINNIQDIEKFKNSEIIEQFYHPNRVSEHLLRKIEKLPTKIFFNFYKPKQIINPINPYIREKQYSNAYNINDLKQKYDNIVISLGHRYYEMYSLISYGIKLNYSIEKIIQDIRSKDLGSKDLKQWNNDKLYNEVNNIIKWMKSTNNNFEYQFSSNSFISNIELIPESIKKYINSFQFKSLIKYNLNLSKKYSKWNEYYNKYISIVAMEIIGKMIYDEQNNKKIKSSLNLTKNKINNLLQGSQFPKNYLNKIKKFYEIENIDIYRLFKAIINTRFFKQYYSSDRGWSYYYLKYCKQFIISNNNFNNIIDKIKNIIKLLKYKYINKKIINIQFNNKIIILKDFFDLKKDKSYFSYDTC